MCAIEEGITFLILLWTHRIKNMGTIFVILPAPVSCSWPEQSSRKESERGSEEAGVEASLPVRMKGTQQGTGKGL